MNEQNRRTTVPVERWIDVHTVRDIWVSDATSIIFFQIIWKEVRLVDYLEASWEWVQYYMQELKDKWYDYGYHFFPHDIEHREFTTWVSRLDTLKSLWLKNIKVTPKLWIMDWIDLARKVFKYIWVDKQRCEHLIDCL